MTAAQEFFAAAMRDYGVREGDHVRIPMRQCELARRRHVAASTVGAYLTAMGASIVSRRPDIVIRLAPDEGVVPPPGDGSPRPDRTADLIGAVADLVAQQARLLRALTEAVACATEPRESARGLGADQAVPREVFAELREDGEEEQQEDREHEGELDQ